MEVLACTLAVYAAMRWKKKTQTFALIDKYGNRFKILHNKRFESMFSIGNGVLRINMRCASDTIELVKHK